MNRGPSLLLSVNLSVHHYPLYVSPCIRSCLYSASHLHLHSLVHRYCITLYFRGRKFSRKVNLKYFREKIFSRIYCSRENIFQRKYLPAKITSRENIFPRKYLPAIFFPLRKLLCILGGCPFNGPLSGTKYPTSAASPIQNASTPKSSLPFSKHRSCALLCTVVRMF